MNSLISRAMCLVFLGCCVGCSAPESGEEPAAPPITVRPQRWTPAAPGIDAEALNADSTQIADADLSVLFIGNSHTAPIPEMLQALYHDLHPEANVVLRCTTAGGFLVDHARSEATLARVRSGPWDFVVLQAQKYSTSGKYHYPHDGALKLAALATEQGAQVIMFPEWSRRSEPDEYLRINAIHQQIAELTGARVAPVGQAWAAAIAQSVPVELYAGDGNHASPAGSFLTACVFYGLLPELPGGDSRPITHPTSIDAATRQTLFEIAVKQAEATPPAAAPEQR